MNGAGLFGEGSGSPVPIAVENFHMLSARQTSDTMAAPGDKAQRVNLLNWDGKGAPQGLFPSRDGEARPTSGPDDGGVQPGEPGSVEPRP